MSEIALAARPATDRSLGRWLARRWFAVFLVLYGLWVWLPWLAPVLMHAGDGAAGRAVYLVYSIFCHQLPERSFFLYGQKSMYTLAEVQAAWQSTVNPIVLRRFVGNAAMGWKVAWSDRMVSFYTSIWLFAIVWSMLRRWLTALPWWGFALLLLPMFVDGATHAISDFAGIGQGFRDTNQWLTGLAGGGLSTTFTAGDALGSFNSWMRLITGILAGLGVAWFALPPVEASFAED